MRPGDNRGHGGVDQRGVMEEGGGVDLSVDNSGSLDHRLDNWGVGNSGNWSGVEDGGGGSEGEGSDSGGSGDNRSRGSGDNGGGGSSDNRGGGSEGERGRDGLGDWVNKTVLVQVLGEPVEGEGLQTTGGSDLH